MLTISEFIGYLKQQSEFVGVKFYNGTIDKNEQKCVGIYLAGRGNPNMALGGPECSSFNTKSISILIHWTENSNQCELFSNKLYKFLMVQSNFILNGRRIINVQMLDDGPIDIKRDENNICEMVIRCNIFYGKKEENESD